MLTDAQKLLHWRQWNAACRANEWRADKGRLAPAARASEDRTIYHRFVWREAERLAAQAHRAVTADDLRHACYRVATTAVPGWPQSARAIDSMSGLDNRAFSRVLVLWALLIDDEDLSAQIKWDHPERSDAEALDKAIPRLAPDAYVREIAARIYGTRSWENLGEAEKRNLRRILCDRRARRAARAPEANAAGGAVLMRGGARKGNG
jgi:hypothetical protein